MNQTKSVSRESRVSGPLAVGMAIVVIAIIVAGEFNLSVTWSLIATALPLLMMLSYERARKTYQEYQEWSRDVWYDDFTSGRADITADARYHCILGTFGFGMGVLGSVMFYARGNPWWWIAVCLIVSIVCLLLGPVEDTPPGE